MRMRSLSYAPMPSDTRWRTSSRYAVASFAIAGQRVDDDHGLALAALGLVRRADEHAGELGQASRNGGGLLDVGGDDGHVVRLEDAYAASFVHHSVALVDRRTQCVERLGNRWSSQHAPARLALRRRRGRTAGQRTPGHEAVQRDAHP